MKKIFLPERRADITRILFWVLLALLLSGCSRLIRPEQTAVKDFATLSSAQPVGQTFVAKYDGLAGVYFYLSPSQTGDGTIRLHLRSEPDASTDLAVSQRDLAIEKVTSPGYYGFLISPLPDSDQKYYYALLEMTGSGEVQVGRAGGSTYLNGALYQDGSPTDAQAAFQLIYARRQVFLGLGLEALSWAGILAVAFLLFILPGWGLFSLLWPTWGRLAWPEKLGLSAGLSLALYPLLLLWTYLVGLRLGPLLAWLPPLAGLAMLLWRNRKIFQAGAWKQIRLPSLKNVVRLSVLPHVVFIIIAGTIVFIRFWAVRSLDLPLGADSYHHAIITQLIVDHGGLFTSWQPYADMNTFTYHFGFHSAVAAFEWLTRMDAPKAVLWVGQVFNILAVLALYPLATRISRSRWAGIVAVLAAGLLFSMPMYYTNWGRYTQLTGQIILPGLVWVSWELLTSSMESPIKNTKGMLAIGSLAFAGLALSHYRILILGLFFLAVLWLLYARRNTVRQIFFRTFWVGLCAGLLFLPWFIRVFGGKIMVIFSRTMAAPVANALEIDPPHSGGSSIAFFLPYFFWLMSLVVIGVAAWRHEKAVILIGLWWSANILAAHPSWLGLPGAGILSSDAVYMAIYIPAAVLAGAGAAWLADRKIADLASRHRLGSVSLLCVAILLVGAGFWGALQRNKDVHVSSFPLAVRPDLRAFSWIDANIPPDARFLINSYTIFRSSVVVGSDGGYWLPFLAHRADTVPPLAAGFERDPWPDYSKKVKSMALDIQAKGIQNRALLSDLQDWGVSYVYIGQRGGAVFTRDPLFSALQLMSDPAFQLVYHQDQVWIFKIQPAE